MNKNSVEYAIVDAVSRQLLGRGLFDYSNTGDSINADEIVVGTGLNAPPEPVSKEAKDLVTKRITEEFLAKPDKPEPKKRGPYKRKAKAGTSETPIKQVKQDGIADDKSAKAGTSETPVKQVKQDGIADDAPGKARGRPSKKNPNRSAAGKKGATTNAWVIFYTDWKKKHPEVKVTEASKLASKEYHAQKGK